MNLSAGLVTGANEIIKNVLLNIEQEFNHKLKTK